MAEHNSGDLTKKLLCILLKSQYVKFNQIFYIYCTSFQIQSGDSLGERAYGPHPSVCSKDVSCLGTVCIVYCSDADGWACSRLQWVLSSILLCGLLSLHSAFWLFACRLDYTMARTQWLVDGRRIAMKVKNATHLSDIQKNWRSDANIVCPNCNHKIDNSDMTQEWPGFPAGVKFDPSDQELLEHLAAKNGIGNARPHVFIDEFILTLEGDHGICYTHPEKLPGVKQDGSAIHFFHRTTRAYTTGTRKRRKIHSARDVMRWHKTGKTRPVLENGEQKGCKKIMVLYMTSAKGSKADKTNWVMHQYHLGTQEDEEDGQFVVSKVFYQKQQRQMDKDETEVPQEDVGTCINKGDPITPKTSAPAPPRSGKRSFNLDLIEEEQMHCMDSSGQVTNIDPVICQYIQSDETEHEKLNDLANSISGNSVWWPGESQCLDDAQQLMDESLFCDEILENHSSEEKNGVCCVPSLPECGRIQSDEVEKDLNHQPDVPPELANIELDTPPEMHFTDSQFSSQESILGWLAKNTDWLANDKSFSKPGENLDDGQCSI